MSSSDSRRPRVAGHRRRPGVPTPTPRTREQDLHPDLLHRSGGDDAPDGAVGPEAEDAAVPEPEAEAEDTTAPEPDAEAPAAAAGRRRALVPALALVLSLALLAAVLLVTRDDPGERARSASAASATARGALEEILSYNHATMTQQLPASQALLTGAFKEEFGTTMTTTIVPLAQKDKTVVQARVSEVGVVSQSGRTVTVQAFVNQARTSDTQKEPAIDQNRVLATMTRVGDRWLLSGLKAY